jgi:methyltransferase (TIGR00027 family)
MIEKDEKIHHVSDTAIWVAQYRAEESARKDAAFHDPYAQKLVGSRGKKIADHMKSTSKYVAWSLVMRTVAIDRFISEAVRNGVDTVVNLGAGLDTRPYRMTNLPHSLKWVEIDFPEMIEYKSRILEEDVTRCHLERYGMDLSDRKRRLELLINVLSTSKNAWVITEGVIPYLTQSQVSELAQDLHLLPSVTGWIGEYISSHIYPLLKTPGRRKVMKNAPFQFFPQDWFGFFEARGWKPREIDYLYGISSELGRRPPAPKFFEWVRPVMPQKWIEKTYQRMGYVIYEKI